MAHCASRNDSKGTACWLNGAEGLEKDELPITIRSLHACIAPLLLSKAFLVLCPLAATWEQRRVVD